LLLGLCSSVGGLVLLPFFVITGWRLVTGRERPGGGLMNPRILDSVVLLGAAASAGRTSLWHGPEAEGGSSKVSARHFTRT